MNKEKQTNNIESLLSLYKEIQDKGSAINKSSPETNKQFGSDLSVIRMMLKDFFQAFGTIDKMDKVKHGNLINDITLISVLIEG